MPCACLWALVALLVCTAADGRSSPDGASASSNPAVGSGTHLKSGAPPGIGRLHARPAVLSLEGGDGNVSSTCNGQPLNTSTCTGVFQYKVEANATEKGTNVSVSMTTDCFGKFVAGEEGLRGLADGSVDVACSGVLRYSERVKSASSSGTNATLAQYRCAYDFNYVASETSEGGKTRGETFQDCKYVDHFISITSSAAPEDAQAMEAELDAIADAFLEETAGGTQDSAAAGQGRADEFPGPYPVAPNTDCKTRITCNGEATTWGDDCVGEFTVVSDCGDAGVDKMVCKGNWIPSTKSATCRGEVSSDFKVDGGRGFFGMETGCKGTATMAWEVKGHLTIWSHLCLGKSMFATDFESSAAPAPGPAPYVQGADVVALTVT